VPDRRNQLASVEPEFSACHSLLISSIISCSVSTLADFFEAEALKVARQAVHQPAFVGIGRAKAFGFCRAFWLSLAPRHCNENLGEIISGDCGSIGQFNRPLLICASPPLSAIKPARISARMSRSSSASAPAPGGCAPPPDHV